MDDAVKQLVRDAIITLINDTISERSILKGRKNHQKKIHFIPVNYRVFGGCLQSLNIKFGNFIEELLALIVEHDTQVTALPFSGKHIPLSMTAGTDALIDQYITQRQLPGSPDNCDKQFEELLNAIILTERNSDDPKQTITKDVDALFRARDGRIIYLEIKYNDDHDTGKFVDINRKFIKTFAGLVNHLEIADISEIQPILYYFNPVKRWGPIYVPSSHIYRGAQLFDEYFEMRFEDIDTYLRIIGDDKDIIKIFDDLYTPIRYNSID
jgi:hypothetical protein